MKSSLTLDSILPEVTRRGKPGGGRGKGKIKRMLEAQRAAQPSPEPEKPPVVEEPVIEEPILEAPVDDVISLASKLLADEDSVLAEVHRLNVVTGTRSSELIRYRLDGTQSVALPLAETLDAGERRIAEALSESAEATVTLVPGGAIALQSGYRKLAEAITALTPAAGAMLSVSEAIAALYVPGAPAIHVVRVKSTGSVRSLTLSELNLTGWRSISCLQVLDQTLYVAVSDPVAGFDLYACDLKKKTASFDLVMTRGGHRFALNATVTMMKPTDTGLILGTAALAGPERSVGNWGPEVITVDKDGSWELVFGVARFTPNGFKAPISGENAGLGDMHNAAVQAIAQEGGRTVVALQSFVGPTQEDRREVHVDLLDYAGPVRLLQSTDLKTWHQIVCDVPDDFGPVTALCLTGAGAYLGFEGIGADLAPFQVVPFS